MEWFKEHKKAATIGLAGIVSSCPDPDRVWGRI